jgi:transposase
MKKETMFDQIWKPILGYENLYEASNDGQIRSFHDKKIKKQSLSSNKKYFRVTVTKNKVSKQITVHRLIAWAFLGKQEHGVEVRHINGNSHDNYISNLKYGSRSDNMQDAIRQNTFSMGEIHHSAKLTKQDVIEIYLNPDDYRKIASMYNIHPFTVHKIKRRKMRKIDTEHIKDLKPVSLDYSKKGNLSNKQKEILNNNKISQRKAAKLLNVSQRTICMWRNQ